jgi:hypothetical protein
MFENDRDSQSAFGLNSTSLGKNAKTTDVPVDPWFQVNQVEFSVSRIERLPQSFVRVAQFFRDGSIGEGQKLLKHCLETASQLFNQWPLNLTEVHLENHSSLSLSATIQRKNEVLASIREICSLKEIGDFETISDCIEDGLVVKLRSCEASLRTLSQVLSRENF